MEINSDGSFTCAICDFGFASVIGRDNAPPVVSGLAIPTTVGLTIKYTAPEIFDQVKDGVSSRLNKEEDKKVDVYAYAVTMYEVVFRKEPYQGESDFAQIMFKVKAGIRPPIVPDIENSFKAFPQLLGSIKNGWASSPDARPSFDEIRKGLKQELEPFIGRSDDTITLNIERFKERD